MNARENNVSVLPVLIVGAGPSGLMMAHELQRFNIPCKIIDKETSKSPYSRAIVVQVRTLEIFHALGLLKALAEKALDVATIEVFAESKQAISIDIKGTTASFFKRLAVVDQPHTEKVLEDALTSLLQEIHYGTELIDYDVHKESIRANLRKDGDVKSERFSYIIGADGAHSTVRKKMANQFVGTTYDDAFILADAECEHPFDHHTFRIFFSKRNFLALIPMHGPKHYRLISVRKGEKKKQGIAPTIEEFQALAKMVIPFPVEIKNPVWVSRFFVQCRSATHYQDERIFLVGDAAHIHSPAGGQGMNTGLQDAFNLAWKLAMVIKGLAKPELLFTYQQERKPVGDFLIDRTDRFFKFMVKSSLWARLLRKIVVPLVGKNQILRNKLFLIASQTAIRYDDGAICFSKKHNTDGDIRVGRRIPNLLLTNDQGIKTDLHSIILKQWFSCWWFVPADAQRKDVMQIMSAINKFSEPFLEFTSSFVVFANDIDSENKVIDANNFIAVKASAAFQVAQITYVICRPDHHVFCIGDLANLSHAMTSLARFKSNEFTERCPNLLSPLRA